MSQAKPNFISNLGLAVREQLQRLGNATRLFMRLLALSGSAVKRFGLVRDQIFFLGNYSLAIISIAASCSPAFIRPISAVSEVPARPANNSAVTTGPSSRTSDSATSRPTASADP